MHCESSMMLKGRQAVMTCPNGHCHRYECITDCFQVPISNRGAKLLRLQTENKDCFLVYNHIFQNFHLVMKIPFPRESRPLFIPLPGMTNEFSTNRLELLLNWIQQGLNIFRGCRNMNKLSFVLLNHAN